MAQRARRIEEETPEPANDALDLMRRVESDPACVLTDEKLFEAYYAEIEREALSTPVDISTETGRDRLKSAAYAISRKKTAIDNAGKALTEEWRRKTSIVNAARNVVKDRFEELRIRVRQPVTAWEESEAARKAEADRIIDLFRTAAIVSVDETADDVKARLDEIRGLNINDEILGPRTDMATDLRDDAVRALTEALERIRKAEEERAELERLRREAQERAETEARERREREAQEAEERRLAEVERIARENAEAAAERAHKEAQEAAESERRAVEAKRNYARSIIQHIKDVGMGMIGGKAYPYIILIRELEEKIVIDEALGDMQDEVRAIRDATLASVRSAQELAAARAEREEREERERREAEEKDRRQADLEHRSNIMRAAKEALMETCGLTEAKAKTVVLQIAAGNVPRINIHF